MDGQLLSDTFVGLTDTMVAGFDVIDFLHRWATAARNCQVSPRQGCCWQICAASFGWQPPPGSPAAGVSAVSEDQLFYLMSRGLTEDETMLTIVRGFVELIARELPMKYALELNRQIELQMERAVGSCRAYKGAVYAQSPSAGSAEPRAADVAVVAAAATAPEQRR
jgi:hypothetical protein